MKLENPDHVGDNKTWSHQAYDSFIAAKGKSVKQPKVRPIPKVKFNPNHDERGRFSSGGGADIPGNINTAISGVGRAVSPTGSHMVNAERDPERSSTHFLALKAPASVAREEGGQDTTGKNFPMPSDPPNSQLIRGAGILHDDQGLQLENAAHLSYNVGTALSDAKESLDKGTQIENGLRKLSGEDIVDPTSRLPHWELATDTLDTAQSALVEHYRGAPVGHPVEQAFRDYNTLRPKLDEIRQRPGPVDGVVSEKDFPEYAATYHRALGDLSTAYDHMSRLVGTVAKEQRSGYYKKSERVPKVKHGG